MQERFEVPLRQDRCLYDATWQERIEVSRKCGKRPWSLPTGTPPDGAGYVTGRCGPGGGWTGLHGFLSPCEAGGKPCLALRSRDKGEDARDGIGISGRSYRWWSPLHRGFLRRHHRCGVYVPLPGSCVGYFGTVFGQGYRGWRVELKDEGPVPLDKRACKSGICW